MSADFCMHLLYVAVLVGTGTAVEMELNGSYILKEILSGYDKMIPPSLIAECLLETPETEVHPRLDWVACSTCQTYLPMEPPGTFDPFCPGHATTVEVSIGLLDIHSVEDSKMEYTAMIFFRRLWVDPRLRFDHLSNVSRIAMHPEIIDKLWIPDLFFLNERYAYVHDVTTPNMLIWLGRNGNVYMSVRLSLTLACSMTFSRFPHETQLCTIDMESYAFTTDTVKLIWAKEKPLTIPKLLRMQQFYLADNGTIDCTYQALYISGRFPCLRVKLSLKRYIAFYLMSTYVPTAFIVVLSWLSFWLDSDAVPGRVTLGVTTVLTMMTQSYISSQSLPKVPYVKALDVWMATCMAFVFAAIMEFGLVNVQRRKEQDEFMRRARALGHDTNSQMSHVGIFTNVYLLGHRNADKIDAASRVIFPVIFVVFISTYWTYYLVTVEHKDR